MAITSKNKGERVSRYGNTQFRYSMIYVAITLIVLLFLNLYSFQNNQTIFFQGKKASMIEKCMLTANEIIDLEVLNTSTAYSAINQLGTLEVERLIITDPSGLVVYDSLTKQNAVGEFALLPEISVALSGMDVFTGQYHNGTIQSHAAAPIISFGNLMGCVYITEFDTEQGLLIQTLQKNILSITLVLAIAILIFSLVFSRTFSNRLQKIMNSMRIIQSGDYSHKVKIGGRDELTFLGDEFNDLTARLQDSERKRRQFVSDASHELKTPLASIKLLSDSILQNDMDVETLREFVADIGNEADRLNRMTLKLLSLTKLEAQNEDESEIVEIRPIAERVLHMLSAIAANNNIQLHSDLNAYCPILILEDDLYQIIFNLVENGIKYNVPGGNLYLTLRRENDNALLEVRDTGVGIPDEALAHIFERFYRVDKARSRQSGGSGLGLAIVRNILERNNGSIHVESTMGSGTTFTLTFPIFDIEEETDV